MGASGERTRRGRGGLGRVRRRGRARPPRCTITRPRSLMLTQASPHTDSPGIGDRDATHFEGRAGSAARCRPGAGARRSPCRRRPASRCRSRRRFGGRRRGRFRPNPPWSSHRPGSWPRRRFRARDRARESRLPAPRPLVARTRISPPRAACLTRLLASSVATMPARCASVSLKPAFSAAVRRRPGAPRGSGCDPRLADGRSLPSGDHHPRALGR